MTRPYLTKHALQKPARRRWSQAEYEAHIARTAGKAQAAAAPKGSKHKNVKVFHDGMKFDSGHELRRWLKLVQWQKLGIIRDLRRQVSFELAPAVDLGEKRKKKAMTYVADFVYVLCETGETVVEDAKSAHTKTLAEYRMKKHWMASVHKIIIQEV
jgi:hypothetical protein